MEALDSNLSFRYSDIWQSAELFQLHRQSLVVVVGLNFNPTNQHSTTMHEIKKRGSYAAYTGFRTHMISDYSGKGRVR
jgi:hypothetical protein